MLLFTLILSLNVISFAICWRFCYLIAMMSDAENILNNDEFYADTINDTPKEQHGKWECLKPAISKSWSVKCIY